MRMLRGDKEIKDTIKGGFGGGRPKGKLKNYFMEGDTHTPPPPLKNVFVFSPYFRRSRF